MYPPTTAPDRAAKRPTSWSFFGLLCGSTMALPKLPSFIAEVLPECNACQWNQPYQNGTFPETTSRFPMQSPREILSDLWQLAGGEPSALEAVQLTGTEPVLPSSFRLAAAAQASIAASALAAI